MPCALAEAAVTQRQVKLEALRAGGSDFPGPNGGLWFNGLQRHGDLRGSWGCIEHFANHVLQIAKVEGLLEQAHARFHNAVVSYDVLGVSGHVEDFYVGANFGDALREFAAVHAGHDDVGQKKMDDGFVRDGNLHGNGAIGGFDDFVALLLEILTGEITKVGFVFDEKNGLVSGLDFLKLLDGSDLSHGFSHGGDAREVNFEGGATPDFAVDPNVSTALLDDSVDGGESEARALRSFRGEERFEDVRLRVLVHAD